MDLIESRIVDSLMFVEFLLFLEDHFGCEILLDSGDVGAFRTVAASTTTSTRKRGGECVIPANTGPPQEGLATLDPLAVRLKDSLDASFLNIAARCRPSACNSRRC